MARFLCASSRSPASSPPASSTSVSSGMSESANSLARAWRSRSAADNPYIGPSGEAFLTERSVYVSIGFMPMVSSADAVVVGGGTVGAWCAYFLREAGLDDVVLIERHTLGQGASSRAAGVVRTQGGTPWAVQLGEWSRRFYLSQRDR